MKKLTSFIAMALAFCFLFGSITSANALEIGMGWAGKSGMAKRVTKGFEQGIKELSPDIKIEYQKELASIEALGEVVKRWEKEKNGMVILRSNGAKWLAKNSPSIPTFIGACNNPSQLGVVKNLQKPEGQITGVTYFLQVDTQFEIFQAILPEMKSVLLLGEGNPSAAVDQSGTKETCKKLGIKYNEVFCSSAEEAIKAVNKYKGKVTAVIIGNQAVIMEKADQIAEAAGKTPVVSYSNKAVKLGALGGFVADDVKLGYMLAKSLVDVLVKGKAIKDVPVKVDPDPKFFLNAITAKKIGVEIPFEILETATVIE